MSEQEIEPFSFTPIGFIHSCYGEKFGIPRQPGLVESAIAELRLHPPYNQQETLRGLESFSHIWILFLFHGHHREAHDNEWKATVRPPRLGGNERMGVFASRSSFRPNPIGLSVVKNLGIKETVIQLGGGDFLDGTPVLDIKPYIPYADAIPEATGGFAPAPPPRENRVEFSPEATEAIERYTDKNRPQLATLIADMLSYNLRPAYQSDAPERIYGTQVFDLEVRWKQAEKRIQVLSVDPAFNIR